MAGRLFEDKYPPEVESEGLGNNAYTIAVKPDASSFSTGDMKQLFSSLALEAGDTIYASKHEAEDGARVKVSQNLSEAGAKGHYAIIRYSVDKPTLDNINSTHDASKLRELMTEVTNDNDEKVTVNDFKNSMKL